MEQSLAEPFAGLQKMSGFDMARGPRKLPAAFLPAVVLRNSCTGVSVKGDLAASAHLGEQSTGVEILETPTPPTVPTSQRLQVTYSLSHLL